MPTGSSRASGLPGRCRWAASTSQKTSGPHLGEPVRRLRASSWVCAYKRWNEPLMPSPPAADGPAPLVHDSVSANDPVVLAVVCAWCGRPLGRGSANALRVSHGICRPCSDDLLYSDAPDLLARR